MGRKWRARGPRGIVETVCAVGVVAVVTAVLCPVVAEARGAAKGGSELSARRGLALASSLYAEDYDGPVDSPSAEAAEHSGELGQRGTSEITYHGGPLLGTVPTGPVNLYYIWYGNWSTWDPAAHAILDNFANSIGGSPYFNINTTYYQLVKSTKYSVQNAVTFKGETFITSASLGLYI